MQSTSFLWVRCYYRFAALSSLFIFNDKLMLLRLYKPNPTLIFLSVSSFNHTRDLLLAFFRWFFFCLFSESQKQKQTETEMKVECHEKTKMVKWMTIFSSNIIQKLKNKQCALVHNHWITRKIPFLTLCSSHQFRRFFLL